MDASQYYFRVSSRRMRDKEVQVISWALSDSNSIRCPSPRLDPSRTVFVGGLHGLINAGMCGVGGVLHGVWVVWWVVWDSCMWVGVVVWGKSHMVWVLWEKGCAAVFNKRCSVSDCGYGRHDNPPRHHWLLIC